MSNEKRAPGLFRGFVGDEILSIWGLFPFNTIRIPIKQPV